jgi:hypothetical protein
VTNDTTGKQHTIGYYIPSSSMEGSVWLVYVPKDAKEINVDTAGEK